MRLVCSPIFLFISKLIFIKSCIQQFWENFFDHFFNILWYNCLTSGEKSSFEIAELILTILLSILKCVFPCLLSHIRKCSFEKRQKRCQAVPPYPPFLFILPLLILYYIFLILLPLPMCNRPKASMITLFQDVSNTSSYSLHFLNSTKANYSAPN